MLLDSEVYSKGILALAIMCGAVSVLFMFAGWQQIGRRLFVLTIALAFLVAPLTGAVLSIPEGRAAAERLEARGCQWEIINGRRTIRSDGPGCRPEQSPPPAQQLALDEPACRYATPHDDDHLASYVDCLLRRDRR